MNPQEEFKKQAAYRAVEFVEPGMVLGLGSGTTASHALEGISERLRNKELKDIVAIPSSLQTAKLARKYDIPLTSLDEHAEIDLTIDGADEVDPRLNLIKGGGGALLREKVLMQASKRNIVIVDESKYSPCLGRNWPVPLEVIPFARTPEEKYLTALGATVSYRRDAKKKLFKTDQGNLILDTNFGMIKDPWELGNLLNARAGIVEHGLFLGLASQVVIAGENGIRFLESPESRGDPPNEAYKLNRGV